MPVVTAPDPLSVAAVTTPRVPSSLSLTVVCAGAGLVSQIAAAMPTPRMIPLTELAPRHPRFEQVERLAHDRHVVEDLPVQHRVAIVAERCEAVLSPVTTQFVGDFVHVPFEGEHKVRATDATKRSSWSGVRVHRAVLTRAVPTG